jgi:AcrR family transcriptional regulator
MIQSRPSARQDLADLTRARVITAVAELIEAGDPQITFQALARVSGIPERTIYRHFPDKDAVLEAFWRWLNDDIAVPQDPESPDQLAPYARALFAAFDRRGGLVRAMLASPSGQKLRDDHAAARHAKFDRALAPLAARLPEADARCLTAATEAICSAPGWHSLAATMGAKGAADAAVWAIEALLARVRPLSTNGD